MEKRTCRRVALSGFRGKSSHLLMGTRRTKRIARVVSARLISVRALALATWLLALALYVASAMATITPQTLLTLRVDVQNAGSVPLPPMTLKVEPPPDMDAFRGTLQAAVAGAIAAAADAEAEAPETDAATQPPFEVDVEIYDARNDRFVRLQSLSQLSSRRSHLNVILRRTSGAQPNHLALPSKLFDSTAFSIRGHVVAVGEVGNSGKGTGLTTWDGSVVLAKYLEHARAADIRDARILEVGAGTGLVGLSAALLGARHVILTDLEYTMENLQRNVAETMGNVHRAGSGDGGDAADAGTAAVGEVTTQVLDWSAPPTTLGPLDFVLASDVVWVEELIPPLVQAFDVLLCSSHAPTTVLMSYQKRSIVSDQLLFSELEKHHLAKRKVPSSALHPEFTSERIDIWEITRASSAAKEEL